MSFRKTPWARMIEQEPAEARYRIMAVFLATDGNTTYAAQHLGISHRSLCRYITQLNLAPQIKKIRKKLF